MVNSTNFLLPLTCSTCSWPQMKKIRKISENVQSWFFAKITFEFILNIEENIIFQRDFFWRCSLTIPTFCIKNEFWEANRIRANCAFFPNLWFLTVLQKVNSIVSLCKTGKLQHGKGTNSHLSNIQNFHMLFTCNYQFRFVSNKLR